MSYLVGWPRSSSLKILYPLSYAFLMYICFYGSPAWRPYYFLASWNINNLSSPDTLGYRESISTQTSCPTVLEILGYSLFPFYPYTVKWINHYSSHWRKNVELLPHMFAVVFQGPCSWVICYLSQWILSLKIGSESSTFGAVICSKLLVVNIDLFLFYKLSYIFVSHLSCSYGCCVLLIISSTLCVSDYPSCHFTTYYFSNWPPLLGNSVCNSISYPCP